MSKSIRKGVEVINKGRNAIVTRTTTLNMNGPMADLVYLDDDTIGCALIADLVCADEAAEQDATTESEAAYANDDAIFGDEDAEPESTTDAAVRDDLERTAAAKRESIEALFGGPAPPPA